MQSRIRSKVTTIRPILVNDSRFQYHARTDPSSHDALGRRIACRIAAARPVPSPRVPAGNGRSRLPRHRTLAQSERDHMKRVAILRQVGSCVHTRSPRMPRSPSRLPIYAEANQSSCTGFDARTAERPTQAHEPRCTILVCILGQYSHPLHGSSPSHRPALHLKSTL